MELAELDDVRGESVSGKKCHHEGQVCGAKLLTSWHVGSDKTAKARGLGARYPLKDMRPVAYFPSARIQLLKVPPSPNTATTGDQFFNAAFRGHSITITLGENEGATATDAWSDGPATFEKQGCAQGLGRATSRGGGTSGAGCCYGTGATSKGVAGAEPFSSFNVLWLGFTLK